jgi:hypothetical protein
MRTRAGVLGGLAIVIMVGVGVSRYGPDKVGLIYHTQGEAIPCEMVDTFEEARQYAFNIAKVGVERGFGGGSYHYIVVYQWVFRMNEDNAVSYHASGMNIATMGMMLVRTDNEDFNKETMYLARQTVIELDAKYHFEFAVNHNDVNPQKPDPHEFIPWITQMGVRWDYRAYTDKIEGTLPEPRYHKWVAI